MNKYNRSESVLLHLDRFNNFRNSFEVPNDISQEGIAETLGIAQSFVSKLVNKLQEKGLVIEKLTPIYQIERQRNVYFLTVKGINEVKELKNRIVKKYIDHADASPDINYYFGREKELKEFDDWLESDTQKILVITGIAGIGKTTFMAKVQKSHKGSMHIFKLGLNEWSTLKGILIRLGDFLSEIGKDRLTIHLQAKDKIDINEIAIILSEDLQYLNALLIFDNFHNTLGNEDINHMFEASKQLLEEINGTKLMVLGREVSRSFYDERDVTVRKFVKEITLEGLDKESGLELLKLRNIEGKKAERLYNFTNGHPLALELVQETDSLTTQDKVRRFMSNEIFSNLTSQERTLLYIASVFRYPAHPTAYIEIAQCGLTKENSNNLETIDLNVIDTLIKKSLLKISEGICDVHDLIREFLYDFLSVSTRNIFHQQIAEYYLENGSGLQSSVEGQHHLIAAGNYKEAVEIILQNYEKLQDCSFWLEFLTNIEKIPVDAIEQEDVPEILLIKGKLYYRNSELDKALRHFDKALDYFERNSNKKGIAQAHRGKGDVYYYKSLFHKSLKSNRKALEIYETSGDLKGIGRALGSIGTIYLTTGEYNKAEKALKKALDYFIKAKDKDGIARIQGNLAGLMSHLGKNDEAITYSKKAFAIFKQLGNKRNISKIHLNIGVYLHHKGECDESIEWMKKAIALAKDISNMPDYFLASMNLAKRYAKRGDEGDLDKAFEIYKKVESIPYKLDRPSAIANLYEAKGIIYGKKGDLNSSEKYFQQCLDIYKSLKIPERTVSVQLDYGRMLAENDKKDKAKEQFENCITLCEKVGLSEYAKEAKEEIKTLSQ